MFIVLKELRFSKKHFSMLSRALRIAETSTCRIKHGAVIVRGGSVLSVGVNTYRNHPNVCGNPETESTYHAEVMALRALKNLKLAEGADIYVARISRDGNPRMSKPCPACQAELEIAGIRNVYYTES